MPKGSMSDKTTKIPTSNGWQKIGIDDTQNGSLAEVKKLDTRCFGDDAFERIAKRPHDFGEIHAMRNNGRLIGYAIYGQLWLPEFPDAYISRIGVHPQHRQNGWGLKILNAILSDIANRPQNSVIWADIRKSNTASQRLFHKSGYSPYCELDGVYNDEMAIRVRKSV